MSIKDSGFIQENSINMCISKALLKPCFVAYGKNGQVKLFPTGGGWPAAPLSGLRDKKRAWHGVPRPLFIRCQAADRPYRLSPKPRRLRKPAYGPSVRLLRSGLSTLRPVLRPSLSFPAASPGPPFVPHTPACPEGRTYCSCRPPPPAGRRG